MEFQIKELTQKMRLIFEFLETLRSYTNYGRFPFPDEINLGFNADGEYDALNDIHLDWDNDLFELGIILGVKDSGGFGKWKDKSHGFKADWNGSIKLKENRHIVDLLYCFNLVGLDPSLKQPVKQT